MIPVPQVANHFDDPAALLLKKFRELSEELSQIHGSLNHLNESLHRLQSVASRVAAQFVLMAGMPVMPYNWRNVLGGHPSHTGKGAGQNGPSPFAGTIRMDGSYGRRGAESPVPFPGAGGARLSSEGQGTGNVEELPPPGNSTGFVKAKQTPAAAHNPNAVCGRCRGTGYYGGSPNTNFPFNGICSECGGTGVQATKVDYRKGNKHRRGMRALEAGTHPGLGANLGETEGEHRQKFIATMRSLGAKQSGLADVLRLKGPPAAATESFVTGAKGERDEQLARRMFGLLSARYPRLSRMVSGVHVSDEQGVNASFNPATRILNFNREKLRKGLLTIATLGHEATHIGQLVKLTRALEQGGDLNKHRGMIDVLVRGKKGYASNWYGLEAAAEKRGGRMRAALQSRMLGANLAEEERIHPDASPYAREEYYKTQFEVSKKAASQLPDSMLREKFQKRGEPLAFPTVPHTLNKFPKGALDKLKALWGVASSFFPKEASLIKGIAVTKDRGIGARYDGKTGLLSFGHKYLQQKHFNPAEILSLFAHEFVHVKQKAEGMFDEPGYQYRGKDFRRTEVPAIGLEARMLEYLKRFHLDPFNPFAESSGGGAALTELSSASKKKRPKIAHLLPYKELLASVNNLGDLQAAQELIKEAFGGQSKFIPKPLRQSLLAHTRRFKTVLVRDYTPPPSLGRRVDVSALDNLHLYKMFAALRASPLSGASQQTTPEVLKAFASGFGASPPKQPPSGGSVASPGGDDDDFMKGWKWDWSKHLDPAIFQATPHTAKEKASRERRKAFGKSFTGKVGKLSADEDFVAGVLGVLGIRGKGTRAGMARQAVAEQSKSTAREARSEFLKEVRKGRKEGLWKTIFGRTTEDAAYLREKAKKAHKAISEGFDSRQATVLLGAVAGGIGAAAASSAPGVFDTLTGSFELLLGEIGEAFLPKIMALSELLQKLADWFRDLSPWVKELIADFGQWSVIGLAAALVAKKLVDVFSALKPVVLAAGSKLKDLLSAVVAHPYMALATAVGVLAGAFFFMGNNASHAADEMQRTLEMEQALERIRQGRGISARDVRAIFSGAEGNATLLRIQQSAPSVNTLRQVLPSEFVQQHQGLFQQSPSGGMFGPTTDYFRAQAILARLPPAARNRALDEAGRRAAEQELPGVTSEINQLRGTTPALLQSRILQTLQGMQDLGGPLATRGDRRRAAIYQAMGFAGDPFRGGGFNPDNVNATPAGRQAITRLERESGISGANVTPQRMQELAAEFSGQNRLTQLEARRAALQAIQMFGLPNLAGGAAAAGNRFDLLPSRRNLNQPAFSSLSDLHNKIQLAALDDGLRTEIERRRQMREEAMLETAQRTARVQEDIRDLMRQAVNPTGRQELPPMFGGFEGFLPGQ